MLTKAALIELPVGKFIRFASIEDMDSNPRDVVVWSYKDDTGRRQSYFDIKNGEYLGEAVT